jgi:hypothetical protein
MDEMEEWELGPSDFGEEEDNIAMEIKQNKLKQN